MFLDNFASFAFFAANRNIGGSTAIFRIMPKSGILGVETRNPPSFCVFALSRHAVCHQTRPPGNCKEIKTEGGRGAFVAPFPPSVLDLPRASTLDNRHNLAVLDEFDFAIFEGEECVIASTADILAGMDLRTALANDDRTGLESLSIICFDAEILGVGIASVTC